MKRKEKRIVMGGLIVTVLATSGFTLSQGPIGNKGDDYKSYSQEVAVADNEISVEQTIENEQLQDDVAIEDKIEIKSEDVTEKEDIKINDEIIANNDIYNINKAYKKGEVVTYNGVEYKAKWWTRGSYPNEYKDWEEVTNVYADGSEDYASGKHYTKGEVVIYNGIKYEAKWWTESTPGIDNSWRVINIE